MVTRGANVQQHKPNMAVLIVRGGMGISFQDYTGIYESALNLRSKRSEVIAGNLANADTPNFKARDFDFQAALSSKMANSSGSHIRMTDDMHFGMQGLGAGGSHLDYRNPTQPSIDGNTVEEQVEHAAFMENTLEFQAAFTMLDSKFKGLKSAIRGE